VNPSIYAKTPYDPQKDFAPVTLAVVAPTVLVVNPAVPATSVKDLVALIKANPGKYSYAVLGVKTAQSMLRPLIRNSMPGAGCNRRNCPRSPSLSSVVSTSAFLQSFPRYSETRGLERYPERSPAIATHRHGRSFIQNWAHLEI
jgi:hypothetical protein